MPRAPRASAGGIVYHVFNRANAKVQIFDTELDYRAFLAVLAEAHEKVPMRLLSYCVMPNHWHLVLWPVSDGEISRYMQWMTLTHVARWQPAHGLVGFGHLYQGHYKQFAVQDDRHYLTVCRYVERNALRAHLALRAEDWPWSSAHQRTLRNPEERPPLAEGPMPLPHDWMDYLNEDQPDPEVQAIRLCLGRGRPYGGEFWTDRVARRLGLGSTLRPRGRPRTP